MDTEKSKHKTIKEQTVGDPGSASATDQNILEQGADAYVQAEQAVSDAYKQVKSYSHENPGKTILIALGVGVGVGTPVKLTFGNSFTTRNINKFPCSIPTLSASY